MGFPRLQAREDVKAKAKCEHCPWTEEVKQYEVSVDAEEAVEDAIVGHVDRNHSDEYSDIRDAYTIV